MDGSHVSFIFMATAQQGWKPYRSYLYACRWASHWSASTLLAQVSTPFDGRICRLTSKEGMPRKVFTSFVSCLSPCTGLSEGEFVSLGYFEKEDLKVLITHLR